MDSSGTLSVSYRVIHDLERTVKMAQGNIQSRAKKGK
jgi:hypothetical protein